MQKKLPYKGEKPSTEALDPEEWSSTVSTSLPQHTFWLPSPYPGPSPPYSIPSYPIPSYPYTHTLVHIDCQLAKNGHIPCARSIPVGAVLALVLPCSAPTASHHRDPTLSLQDWSLNVPSLCTAAPVWALGFTHEQMSEFDVHHIINVTCSFSGVKITRWYIHHALNACKNATFCYYQYFCKQESICHWCPGNA